MGENNHKIINHPLKLNKLSGILGYQGFPTIPCGSLKNVVSGQIEEAITTKIFKNFSSKVCTRVTNYP